MHHECVGVLFTANRFRTELLQVNPLFTHVHVDWTDSWQPYNRAGYPMLPYMGNRPIWQFRGNIVICILQPLQVHLPLQRAVLLLLLVQFVWLDFSTR